MIGESSVYKLKFKKKKNKMVIKWGFTQDFTRHKIQIYNYRINYLKKKNYRLSKFSICQKVIRDKIESLKTY